MKISKAIVVLSALFGLMMLWACNLPFGDSDPVLISVGARKLTLSEVRTQAPDWDSWDDRTKLSYLEHWVDEETIYQEAIASGVDRDSVLVYKMNGLVRKMVVDYFLESFTDTMMVGDAEKIDFYHAHPEMFVRGQTLVSGGFVYFRDWTAADLYYRGHRNLVYDSVPAMHYLVKKIESFDSLPVSPDSCVIPDIQTVTIGKISNVKVCGGAIKMGVVVSRLDSADVLPYEEVAERVANLVWIEHKNRVMDRLKKEWKLKRPIFSETEIFSDRDKR